MEGRRAVFAEGGEVLGGGVALVLRQAVLRIDGVPFFHARVAMRFGEDGGGGDGDAAGVTMDQGFLFDKNVELHGVEQKIVGDDAELLEGGCHGLAAGLVNVPGVNALGVDFGDRPGEGMFADARSEFSAAIGSEFFGVVEADDAAFGIQDYCGGYHGAEESAAAGFIDAGDAQPTLLASFAFESRATLACHRGDSSMPASGRNHADRVCAQKKTGCWPVF